MLIRAIDFIIIEYIFYLVWLIDVDTATGDDHDFCVNNICIDYIDVFGLFIYCDYYLIF